MSVKPNPSRTMPGQSNKTVKLSESMEDYLEAIALVKQKRGIVRVKDITRLLDVEAPSVTSALANLSRKGYVVHERYGHVDLTAKGERAAKDVIKRHWVLFDFLTLILGVRPEIAMKDACGMEHSLSRDTLRRLSKLVEFCREHPETEQPEWLTRFDHYRKTGRVGHGRRKIKT